MQISEGTGWRLLVEAKRHPYGVLIGADHWAVELRHSELRALVRGVACLVEQHHALQPSLMQEEEISLELDLDLAEEPAEADESSGEVGRTAGVLHVALEGDALNWALRFVLTPADGARGVEGAWSTAASPALAAALSALQGSEA